MTAPTAAEVAELIAQLRYLEELHREGRGSREQDICRKSAAALAALQAALDSRRPSDLPLQLAQWVKDHELSCAALTIAMADEILRIGKQP